MVYSFFELGRSWLKKSNKYTLSECFVSTNCYLCIELNAHSLVKQLLKLVDDLEESKFGHYMFVPDLQGSQPCEDLFRQARSFSSMYSNVVNFTMLEFINRVNKIQLQADIIKNYSCEINFPRFEDNQNTGTEKLQSTLKLSKAEIIAQIEKARCDLTADITSLGVDCTALDYHCQIQPTKFEHEFAYEQLSDDDMSDENVSDDGDIEKTIEDVDELEEEDRRKLSGISGELLLQDYSRTGLNVDEDDIYAIVTDSTGKEKKVRKSAIVWYLNNNKSKLSSDRLHRVKAKDYDKADDKGSKFVDIKEDSKFSSNFLFQTAT